MFFFFCQSTCLETLQYLFSEYITVEYWAFIDLCVSYEQYVNLQKIHYVLYCSGSQTRSSGPTALHVLDVSLLQHTWFKWTGRYQASAELDDELIIWVRCVGRGRHLRAVSHYGPGCGPGSTCQMLWLMWTLRTAPGDGTGGPPGWGGLGSVSGVLGYGTLQCEGYRTKRRKWTTIFRTWRHI